MKMKVEGWTIRIKSENKQELKDLKHMKKTGARIHWYLDGAYPQIVIFSDGSWRGMKDTTKISDQLEITEEWTNEKTPQLEHVKITEVHGVQGITAKIRLCDLPETINKLKRINEDATLQINVKKRSGGATSDRLPSGGKDLVSLVNKDRCSYDLITFI